MRRPTLHQRLLHHALSNARWYLLLGLVLGWYGALALRLQFLRAQGETKDEIFIVRAHADRKSLPMKVAGNGAYFHLQPESLAGAAPRWRLQPLGRLVRVDGVEVGEGGAALETGNPARKIQVDGLELRFFKQGRQALLAVAAWEVPGPCWIVGKSLSADVSLDAVGVPPLAAKLCKDDGSLENLSASQSLVAQEQTLQPHGKSAWDTAKPLRLQIGPASRPVELQVEVLGPERISVRLADKDLRPQALQAPTVVGNLQMQFTRVMPGSKADYQLLEQLQEALDRNQLALSPVKAAANVTGLLPRLMAAAVTTEERQSAAVLEDGRVRRLLMESRRELESGDVENAHVYVEGGEGDRILDIRDRALRVVAPKDVRKADPMQVVSASGQSPWFVVLSGPMKGSKVLTDAPVAAGRCDLMDLGAADPETLVAPTELRRPSAEEPGGVVLAGRTIVFSKSGGATLHPELPPDLSASNRAFVGVQPGDTLDGIVRRLALTPEMRPALKTKLLAANPGLDPRRLRPGQRLTVEAWPEVSIQNLRATRTGAYPHIQLERRNRQSFLKVVTGPVALDGEPLPVGAVLPLRSGDRVTLGSVPLSFQDTGGVLRERKLSQDRWKDFYPMGSNAVLLSGFEDRLAPLAKPIASGIQQVSVSADLQHVATSVLREHLAYLDRLPGRAYARAGKLHAGSITVMDWKTGALLAAASLPAFDPAATGSYQEASRKFAASSPFLNRAMSSLRPAGSTFKVLVLAAYLEHLERIGKLPALGQQVGPTFSCGDGVTRDSGSLYLDGRQLRCHRAERGGHGIVRGAGEALEKSCNVYFAKLALSLGGLRWDEPMGTVGPHYLVPRGHLLPNHPLFEISSRLGFDFDYRGLTAEDRRQVSGFRTASAAADWFAPAGISPLSVPVAGLIPAPAHFYRDSAKKPDWTALGLPTPSAAARLEYKPLRHLAYLAIGQDMTVSTYHLAVLTAAIAGDGFLPMPWVDASAPREAGRRVFSAPVARHLRAAMALVTGPEGTAPVLRDVARGGRFPFTIYAKTGTAQVAASQKGAPEERRADSLLISFIDDPRLPPLAVAFRVENGDATRDAKGLPLPTPAKHLAARFYSALLELYGLWPERAQSPIPIPPETNEPADEPESLPSDEPEHPAPPAPIVERRTPSTQSVAGLTPGQQAGSPAETAASPTTSETAALSTEVDPSGTAASADGLPASEASSTPSEGNIPRSRPRSIARPAAQKRREPTSSEITRQLNQRNLQASRQAQPSH